MLEQIVQNIGLIVALGFIVFSIDDLVWDISGIIRSIRRGERARLPFERLDAVPPKLLAVIVAAWREDNVLEAVIDNMISSLQYPESMYHVFIGVYPNDEPTVNVVKKLEQRFANVHMVINGRPGPTCKADNINNIIRYIKQFEAMRQWCFGSVTIHDSEDVVHPYELKLTNYLLDSHDVLQFPVIPLQRMPALKSVFRDMTVGTYADEFAENHYRTMGSREAMSAVVPSAGTGFVISHAILDAFGDEPLCPEDSLTEDYKLSLILAKKGFNTHFVLEKVPRLMDNHTVRWDYVATRSFFPDTFRTAVRQKTRWIYGITMQSAKISEMFGSSRIGFTGRYSLYKDLKAKMSNLMALPGYLVFLYFVLSLFVPVPYMYPRNTLAYELCVFLTIMMVFRLIMRAVAITNFYGFKSMAAACLLPPLMPIRLVWGNIINMTATFKAWRLFFRGTGAKRKKKKVAWSKTDHTFLKKQVLHRYYRNIGDVLLEKQYIDVSGLSAALRQSRAEGLRIGDVLLRRSVVSEEQLAEAAAYVRHEIFVKDVSVFAGGLADAFDRALLERLLVYPLLRTKTGYVFAATEYSDTTEIPKALGLAPEECSFVYTAKSSVLKAVCSESGGESPAYRLISEYLGAGSITWQQAVLALDKYDFTPDILAYMGLKDTGRSIIKSSFPPASEDFSAAQNNYLSI
jgi:adsorption protein B